VTEAQAIELIGERFVSQWPTLTAALPGAPGAGYPFALKDEALPAADTFAVCTWKHTRREQVTMGQPSRKRSQLLIMVKLWSPFNAGSAALAALADVVRQIFEAQQLGTTDTVNIFTGATGSEATDGRWTMSMVTFPAFYELRS